MALGPRAIEKELLLRSFPRFCAWVFREIHRIPYDQPFHVGVLQSVATSIYNLELLLAVINIAPRYFKTETMVILFCAWCFAKNSRCKFIHTSFSNELALRNSNAIKNIIKSAPFVAMFGEILGKEETAKQLWSTKDGGGFRAASSGAAITGFGAGRSGWDTFSGALIMDDPNKPDDIGSDKTRQNVIDNYENTLSTRVEGKNVPVILIMQRLHEEDLSGHLLSGNSVSGEFEHICLPSIKDDRANKYDNREEGQPLFPEKHSL